MLTFRPAAGLSESGAGTRLITVTGESLPAGLVVVALHLWFLFWFLAAVIWILNRLAGWNIRVRGRPIAEYGPSIFRHCLLSLVAQVVIMAIFATFGWIAVWFG